jgi:hypothetical protein
MLLPPGGALAVSAGAGSEAGAAGETGAGLDARSAAGRCADLDGTWIGSGFASVGSDCRDGGSTTGSGRAAAEVRVDSEGAVSIAGGGDTGVGSADSSTSCTCRGLAGDTIGGSPVNNLRKTVVASAAATVAPGNTQSNRRHGSS